MDKENNSGFSEVWDLTCFTLYNTDNGQHT